MRSWGSGNTRAGVGFRPSATQGEQSRLRHPQHETGNSITQRLKGGRSCKLPQTFHSCLRCSLGSNPFPSAVVSFSYRFDQPCHNLLLVFTLVALPPLCNIFCLGFSPTFLVLDVGGGPHPGRVLPAHTLGPQ